MNLTTAADLAKTWGITEDQLHHYRVRNNWPCVKFGRNDVRFTDEQLAAILEIQSHSGGSKAKKRSGGLSSRSAARSA
jgi:hypothetical protein